jgi:hypothetical protein
MAKYLAPAPKFQAFDDDGNPLSGGLVYTSLSGTDTPATTWTDSTGNTANTNPVVLDSRGEASIWFTPGTEYRITVTDSTGGAIYGPIDNVAGSVTPSAYFATIMSGTSQTEVFDDVVAPGGTITGTILMSGAALNMAAPVTVASATSTPIGAAASNNVTVSGVATITSFDNVTAGIIRYVTFSGILTLTYNATSMQLPGAANITTAAGDVGIFQSLGSGNWKCLVYQRADGTAIAGTETVASQADMETATSITTMVTPGRTQYHPGVAKAVLVYDGVAGSILASYNISGVTKNATGDYSISFTTPFSSANYSITYGGALYRDANTSIIPSVYPSTTPSTTGFRVALYGQTHFLAQYLTDSNRLCITIHGDQ